MLPERRRQMLLVVLLVVLVGVLYRALTDRSVAAPDQVASTPARSGEPRRAAAGQAAEAAPAVHLDALARDRPKPPTASRDLFRFGQRQAPPPIGTGGGGRVSPPPPAPPPGPPPPPPISMKFIGVVEQGGNKPKLAILTDGLGPPLYAVEGGTVAGRFRVVRIGAESIEMEYLDGRGRQTIRLSGS